MSLLALALALSVSYPHLGLLPLTLLGHLPGEACRLVVLVTVVCVRVLIPVSLTILAPVLQQTRIVFHEHANVLVQFLVDDFVLLKHPVHILEDLICDAQLILQCPRSLPQVLNQIHLRLEDLISVVLWRNLRRLRSRNGQCPFR